MSKKNCVMMRLAPALGRQRAHDVVYEACMAAFAGGPSLEEALLAHEDVARALTHDELRTLLDPRNYTGLAATFVDRVLDSDQA